MYGITIFVAAIFGLVGLALAVGGGVLVSEGGSAYYLIAGIAYVAAAVCIARRWSVAAKLYALLLLATLLWAFAETNFSVWALLPRILLPAGLGLVFVLPYLRRAVSTDRAGGRIMAAALTVVAVTFLASIMPEVYSPAASLSAQSRGQDGQFQWSSWGADPGGSRFAPLNEITPANVRNLKQVWSYRTRHATLGGKPTPPTTFQTTPLQVGKQLILCTPFNTIISVDGDTGKEMWRFHPGIDRSRPITFVCRGVAYVKVAGVTACTERILATTLDNRLLALDAQTGKICPGFGQHGVVDLLVGMGQPLPGYLTVTSPPTIVNGTAVVGSFVLDGQSTDEPSGVVRGYDVRTGAQLWAWDAISPDPVAPGTAYVGNTPNMWSVASADPALNLVYLPMGGGTPDLFGGHRPPEHGRYGSSVTAIDASTGKVRWSFQTVHHDVWDYDVASQPVLFEFSVRGQAVPALAAPTKRGEIFILDRRTGAPLIPVEERPVPGGGVSEERLSPTQPYVKGFPSFAPPRLKEADMWGITPFDQLWCRVAFRRARYDGAFTPPTTQGTVVHPGPLGGFNWGSVTIDSDRNLLIGNFNLIPYVFRLIPRHEADARDIVAAGSRRGATVKFERGSVLVAQEGLSYAASMGVFVSPLGVPCTQPPWGQIAAIELDSRSVRWERPLGTTRDLAPLGISLPTGTPNIGGAITTRGGITFVGAAADDYLRAFDSATGAELWRARLPAGPQATPMTYVSPTTGRQFVVIAAGGHATLGTRQGDFLIAYALDGDAAR